MKVSSLIVEILANQLIIPYQIHTNMLPLLIKADTFLVQFRKRIAKFVNSFLVSENSYVSFIGELAKYNSYGVLGRNLTRVVFNNNNIPVASDISIELLTCAKAIQELLDVRDRIKEIPELNYTEIDIMIENLCCM